MTKLPQPLVPAEVDLRDFQFMPLDVVRLRDSDLASLETPEVCWAALLLWCASWHQQPAASLPEDDRVLSKFAGYGRVITEWQRVRDGALRNWVKCSDGRLYHPVVAEKAREAWQSKLERLHRRECDRIRKENNRRKEAGETALPIPTFEEWNSERFAVLSNGKLVRSAGSKSDSDGTMIVSNGNGIPSDGTADGIPPENPLKGQGQGQGQGYSELRTPTAAKPPRANRSRDSEPDWLEDFKREFPDRLGDQGWQKAVRAGNARIAEGHTPAQFIDGAKRYHAHCKALEKIGTQYVKQAASFLGPDKHFLQPWPVSKPVNGATTRHPLP